MNKNYCTDATLKLCTVICVLTNLKFVSELYQCENGKRFLHVAEMNDFGELSNSKILPESSTAYRTYFDTPMGKATNDMLARYNADSSEALVSIMFVH